MKEEDKLLEFIIFCVESTEVYRKLKATGALENYVKSYYDTLHTQGETYIVDSLLEYVFYRDAQWLPEGYVPYNQMAEGGERC